MSTRSPSIRKRTRVTLSHGSIWMSLARFRYACSTSMLTKRTIRALPPRPSISENPRPASCSRLSDTSRSRLMSSAISSTWCSA